MQNKFSTVLVPLFLSQEHTVRLYADRAPGFGNQAGTFNLIAHIRRLGFNGTVELIYHEETTSKIEIVFNLPPQAPAIYHDTVQNISFVKLRAHLTRLETEAINVVNIGAAVTTGYPSQSLSQIFHGSPLENPANLLRVNLFYMFGPYMNSKKYSNTRVHYLDNERMLQLSDGHTYYVISDSQGQSAVQQLTSNEATQPYLRNNPALVRYAEQIDAKKWSVTPVYGYTVQEGNWVILKKPITPLDDTDRLRLDAGSNKLAIDTNEDGTQEASWTERSFPGNILKIVLGARYAQLTGASVAQQNKPVVISVFYDYWREATQLERIINDDDWGDLPRVGSSNVGSVIKELHLSGMFQIANISDPGTSEMLSNLSSDQVLLLSMGTLPKFVFETLYTRGFPVIEGASSFNLLANNGIPHLSCSHKNYPTTNFTTDALLRRQIQDFYSYDGFCTGMYGWNVNPDNYRQVGNFILDAQNDTSPFSNYFHTLRDATRDPQNDRVLQALYLGTYQYIRDTNMFLLKSSVADTGLKTPLVTSVAYGATVKYDPYTNRPIFTLVAFSNTQQVGTAEFYDRPVLCFSSDNTTHNVLSTTGLLTSLRIGSAFATEVCSVLPPLAKQSMLEAGTQGAVLGAIEVGATLSGTLLHHYGFVNKKDAKLMAYAIYLCAIFCSRIITIGHEKEINDQSNSLNDIYYALLQTAQIIILKVILDVIGSYLDAWGKTAQNNGWDITGKGISIAGRLAPKVTFAYSSLSEGVAATSVSITAGVALESLFILPQRFFPKLRKA